MDVFQYRTFINKIMENEKKQQIVNQLLIAEAINFAYIGSQPPEKKGGINHGSKNYAKWRERKTLEIYPESRPRSTVWDRIKKLKRSIKVN